MEQANKLLKKNISIETFIFINEIEDKNFLDNFIKVILNKKKSKEKTYVIGEFTGFDSLINEDVFHIFLKTIKPQIKNIFPGKFVIHDAWANICNKNDQVLEHNHKGITGFCGILYLTEGGPGTYFKHYDLLVEEKKGRYVLFHPYLLHNVPLVKNDVTRISVAFNMNKLKNWDNTTESKTI
jgi:hypothetical protein